MCFGTEGSSCSFLTFWEARKSPCSFVLHSDSCGHHAVSKGSDTAVNKTVLHPHGVQLCDFCAQMLFTFTDGMTSTLKGRMLALGGRWVHPTQRPYPHNEEPEHQRKELTCLRFRSLSGHGETYNPFLPIKCSSSIMGCFHSAHIINSPFTPQN